MIELDDLVTFGTIGGILGERDKRSSSSLSFFVVKLRTIFLFFDISSRSVRFRLVFIDLYATKL